MSLVESKKSTDFMACFDNYSEATRELLYAVYEHAPDEAAAVQDSLMPTYEITKSINDRIRAAKRHKRMVRIRELMPNEGDECIVDICPCPSGDGETWMVRGRVRYTWFTDKRVEGAIKAVIEVIRPLTDEENHNWQTDASWNGAVFVCRLNTYLNDWRAIWPANDIAREQWGCQEDE